MNTAPPLQALYRTRGAHVTNTSQPLLPEPTELLPEPTELLPEPTELLPEPTELLPGHTDTQSGPLSPQCSGTVHMRMEAASGTTQTHV